MSNPFKLNVLIKYDNTEMQQAKCIQIKAACYKPAHGASIDKKEVQKKKSRWTTLDSDNIDNAELLWNWF